MKRFQILVFAFLVVINVSIARVYDEKSDAIKDIEKKFKEAQDLRNSILTQIKNELTIANSPASENESLKLLGIRLNETKIEFEEDADAVIRTAIVKNKPVAVIYCIRNTADKVREEILQLENSLKKDIFDIRANKFRKINFDDYAANAIIKGLQELKAQSIEKINKGQEPISQLKKEAINRCASAMHLLGEIEVSVSEPSLPKEYIKMKQSIERKLRESKVVWKDQLEKCLESKILSDIITAQ